VTFTKEYTVGFTRADFDIPKQSWKFFGSQPGHSTCIMKFVGEWGERRFFAVSLFFKLICSTTIYSMESTKIESLYPPFSYIVTYYIKLFGLLP
jgi:hypothetical protein